MEDPIPLRKFKNQSERPGSLLPPRTPPLPPIEAEMAESLRRIALALEALVRIAQEDAKSNPL